MVNAQAIVVSDEVWTSAELQVVLYSKRSDPRSGDRIYRLTNLKRDEVAASQFSVPSDYKVRDLSKEMKVIVKEKNEKAEQSKYVESGQQNDCRLHCLAVDSECDAELSVLQLRCALFVFCSNAKIYARHLWYVITAMHFSSDSREG